MSPPPPPSPEPLPALRKVLVVDDDEDIGVVAKLALSLDGSVAVEVCSEGEKAVATAGRFQPDVVLLDVMMPGLDGPATLARMRGNPALAQTPVVFLTAKALPAEIERLLALGAVGVIPKPFAPMTLLDRVRRICQGAESAAAALPAIVLPSDRFRQRKLRDAGEFSALLRTLEAAEPECRYESLISIDLLAHKLHGAAATFGASDVAQAVLSMRLALRTVLENPDCEIGALLASMRALIAMLEAVRY